MVEHVFSFALGAGATALLVFLATLWERRQAGHSMLASRHSRWDRSAERLIRADRPGLNCTCAWCLDRLTREIEASYADAKRAWETRE